MGRLTRLPGADRLRSSRAPADLNFRRIQGRMLVTNTVGHHVDLSEADFVRFVEGRLSPEEPLWKTLRDRGFLRERIDLLSLAETYRRKNAFLWRPPGLHIVVVTLRCNHKCLYCHASVVGENRSDLDMTLPTARRTVDFIFQTPRRSVLIEFQGGEPLMNWPAIRFITRYARMRAEAEEKGLYVALISNFSLMDEEKFRFIADNGIGICTSLDGPQALHDKNRIWRGGRSHAETVRWLQRFQGLADERAQGPGRHNRPGALTTITRFSFGQEKEIVDAYLELGLPTIYLRPLSPIGFARRVWGQIGYTPAQFLEFYRRSLDYILELNRGGTRIVEQSAKVLLTKILRLDDPGHVDIRSPSGGGLGVLGYNYNGDIYTGDEGRMLSQEGNEAFRLGHVARDRYNDVVSHAANRACTLATTLEAQPLCAQCSFRPYCGACPVFNTETQDSFWGQMPSNGRCETFMGLFDTIFEKLRDPENRRIFESWIAPDPD